ncbi:MAG: DMT family transporter, partial [Acidimicrobiia bacterium]|nr:DMT family transporter [Acidimicrobiia bacterium]
WTAVAVGLLGVLVIVRPGAGVFEPAVILALLAAVSYATGIILTRKVSGDTNGASMTLVTVVFFVVAGLVLGLLFSSELLESIGSSPHPSLAFLYRPWTWPVGTDWLLLIAIGVISGIGFFALTQAYRLAEASLVTSFEYTYLPWSVLWGWVFFSTLPDVWTWIGLVLIVGAGLGIVYREAQLYRRRGRRRLLRRGLGVLRQR